MSTKYELVIAKDGDKLAGPIRIDLSRHTGKENALLLGREEKSTGTMIFSSDGLISRQHCVVWMEHNQVYVKDLGALNNTFLNKVQLIPDKPTPFPPGQILTMGKTPDTPRLTVEITESDLTVVPTLAGLGFDQEQPGFVLDAKINLKDFEAPDSAVLKSRLKWMFETSQGMSTVSSLGGIVDICLNQLMAAFPDATHVLLVLYSRKGEVPSVIKRHIGPDSNYSPEGLACARFRANDTWDTHELKLSKTVLNRVQKDKIAFWINAKDLKSMTALPSVFDTDNILGGAKIAAIMASPLLSGDKNVGLIQLFGNNGFTDEDVNILRMVAGQTALIVRNIELAFTALEEQTRRENLQHFFAPAIAEGLLNGKLHAKLGGQLRNATIFYSDICGFTRLAAGMKPADVVSLLNRYFSVMQDLVFRRGGSVDKCAGDQIMAFWGVLADEKDFVANAVTAGLEMQIALFEFNRDHSDPARAGFTLPAGGLAHGIGLHTGEVCAGNIGGTKKMEFTVIGDVVNVANRIEGAAGRGQVFVSDTTWSTIAPRAFGFRLPPVSMKNVRQQPPVMSVRGIVPPGSTLVGPAGKFHIGQMLLNLPCSVTIVRGATTDAVATGLAPGKGGKSVFVLQAQTALIAGADCQIVWKIPESKRFTPLNGKVLRSDEALHLKTEEDAVAPEPEERCGLAFEQPRLAPGTALIEVAGLPPEWAELKPGSLWFSDYKSEHEIIR